MPEKVSELPRRDRLSWRLMAITLLLAFAIGVLLSVAQILVDSRSQSAEIDRSVEGLLAMMREPATEAAYNIDDRLAQRVLDGVLRFDGVIGAQLSLGEDEPLAQESRPPVTSSLRFVTAALFGDRRDYAIALRTASGERVGELRLQLDTFPPGQAFLARAGVVIATDVLRTLLLAVALLAVFHFLLTRPLVRMVHALASFDPDAPESIRLEAPARHEHDELGLWARSVNRLLGAIRDNLARRAEAETRATWLEHFDNLTGLANRKLLLANTAHAIATAGPDVQQAIVIVDIHDFREINEQFGVEYGDDVLRELALRLKALAGGHTALTVRLAEDAFAFLLSGPGVRTQAAALATALQVAFESPLRVGAHALSLRLDMGIAIFPDDAQNAELLVQNAERALAYTKSHPAADSLFYQAEHDNELQSRKRLTRDLRVALQRGEISVNYQPLMGAGGSKLIALEALVRWTHADLGRISPAEFVPVAESSGQIHAIGEWVLRRACLQAATWQRLCSSPLRIAVNVSAAQLRERGFEGVVASALADAKLPAQLLELEITETALIENLEQAIGTLQRLRAAGVRISIDDFGTGHASLSYLKRLPIDQLKIDISFIRDVLRDPSDAQIVKAIVNLGHSLELEVVAEGVEEEAQREFLSAQGCDLMQGYLFHRPMDVAECATYLQRLSSKAPVVVPISGRRGS